MKITRRQTTTVKGQNITSALYVVYIDRKEGEMPFHMALTVNRNPTGTEREAMAKELERVTALLRGES